MLFDNPEDDARARKAFETLCSLCENNDEFYLLIAVIRVFHEVKAEHRDKQRKPNLSIVKPQK